MNYKIVQLEEKILVGVCVQTSNTDTHMKSKINQLWTDLYQNGISASILNKVNEYAIGLYSDYTEDGYTVTAGNEVHTYENNDLTTKIIPGGKYAKFSVRGPMDSAVGKAWAEIWQMDLDRSYTGDFEEYLDSNFDDANIDIYISLK